MDHETLVGQYSHLKNLPREKDAIHTIKKIASLVKPIMRARNFKVGTLAEFYPAEQNLLGEFFILFYQNPVLTIQVST